MSCHKVKKSYFRNEIRSLHVVIPITRGLGKKNEKVGRGEAGGGGNLTKKNYINPKIF
jgi:hypothetical protein